MTIKRFEDIESWQLARELCLGVYAATKDTPLSRDFGLKDQMTRASGSVMHNIAEGFDAGSNPEFCRFLGYAKRSCTEVQSQLYLARDLGYLSEECFADLFQKSQHTRNKIGAFLNYLRSTAQP